MKQNILIIDADSILHVASLQETFDEATHYFDEKTHYIVNFLYENHSFDVNELFIVIGGQNNFRKFLVSSYKANRPPKPPLYPLVKGWVLENVKEVVTTHGVESDDVIAALANRYRDDNDVVVASLDKDLRQIHGVQFFNIYHTKYELEWVDEITALRQHYTLMLTGDSSDNIKVKSGYGKVKAAKLLKDKTTEFGMRKAVFSIYLDKWGRKAREKYMITKSLVTLRDDESLIPEMF